MRTVPMLGRLVMTRDEFTEEVAPEVALGTAALPIAVVGAVGVARGAVVAGAEAVVVGAAVEGAVGGGVDTGCVVDVGSVVVESIEVGEPLAAVVGVVEVEASTAEVVVVVAGGAEMVGSVVGTGAEMVGSVVGTGAVVGAVACVPTLDACAAWEP